MMNMTKGKPLPSNKGNDDIELVLSEDLKKITDKIELYLKFTKTKEIMEGETPSAFTFASARGLAKLGAAMANKGSFNGNQILSEQGWDEFHAEPKMALELSGGRTNYTQGGINRFFTQDYGTLNAFEKGLYPKRDGFYGWMGFGGSVF